MKFKWYLFFVIKMALYTHSTCQNVACLCPFDTLFPPEFKQNWAIPILPKASRDHLDHANRSSYRPFLDSLFSYYVVPDTLPGEYRDRDGILRDIENKKVSKKCIIAYFGKPDRRLRPSDDDGKEYWIYYFRVHYLTRRSKKPIASDFFAFVFERHREFACRAYSDYTGE